MAQSEQIEGAPAARPARDLMWPAPATLHPDHELDEAQDRLRDQEYGVLPVLDGDQIVGVLSRAEIELGLQASARAPRRVTARHVMRTELAFCYEGDAATTARAMMDRHGIDHLLVVDRDMVLVGVLERSNLPPVREGEAEVLAHEPAVAEPREGASEGLSSNIQPGGLEVYPERPTIKVVP